VLLGARFQFFVFGAGALSLACPQLVSEDFRSFVPMAGSGSGGFGPDGAPDDGPTDVPTPGADSGPETPGLDAGSDVPADGGAETNVDASTTPQDVLRAALSHRFGFEGTGSSPVDSIGGAEALIYDGVLDGQGFVHLSGEEYVSLQNGLISSGYDKTIEAWLLWRGGAPWQRIFDIGVSTNGELEQGQGLSYLFLAATSDQGVMLVSYSQNGSGNAVRLNGSVPLPTGTLTHVAVVVNRGDEQLSLYLNGTLNASMTFVDPLSAINDVNSWIGHSQFEADPNLDADVTEFRIYEAALDAEQVATSYALGPDGLIPTAP
jgi:hypothetical protein